MPHGIDRRDHVRVLPRRCNVFRSAKLLRASWVALAGRRRPPRRAVRRLYRNLLWPFWARPVATFARGGGSLRARHPGWGHLLMVKGTTLAEHVESLRANGLRVSHGSAGTYWVESAHRLVRRLPTFHAGEPTPAEVDRALLVTGALIASYLIKP